MHYVLAVGVITLYIYFRFGIKALAGSVFLLGVLALSRGLVALALPLFIIAYFLIRKTDILPKLPWDAIKESTSILHPKETGPVKPTLYSRFVLLYLSTDNSDLSGRIHSGPSKGVEFSDLTTDEYCKLLKHYAKFDREGEQILVTYLDQKNPKWQSEIGGSYKANKETSSYATGKMKKKQALLLLGLSLTPTENEIKASHRNLMKKYHPDQGGSPFLAAKINMAKDLLLK